MIDPQLQRYKKVLYFLSWLNLRKNKGVVVGIIDRDDRKRDDIKRKCFNAISQ